MEIEQWLEKNKIDSTPDEVISVRAFGDWAWDELVRNRNHVKGRLNKCLNSNRFNFAKLATAFLGKKEFDRRMRNKIKKKTEQKKQRKVSSIAEEIQSKDATGLH